MQLPDRSSEADLNSLFDDLVSPWVHTCHKDLDGWTGAAVFDAREVAAYWESKEVIRGAEVFCTYVELKGGRTLRVTMPFEKLRSRLTTYFSQQAQLRRAAARTS